MMLTSEIRNELRQQGMTAKELSIRAGIPSISIYRKLRGERAISVEELQKISKALSLQGSTLLRRAEQAAQACVEEASNVSP